MRKEEEIKHFHVLSNSVYKTLIFSNCLKFGAAQFFFFFFIRWTVWFIIEKSEIHRINLFVLS